MMTSDEILDELAAQTDEIREFVGVTFELSEDYWAICDARLSAFSSEEMWAVVVEVVGYHYGLDTYPLHIWLFGNCVQEREEFYLPDFARDLLTVPADWNQRTEKISWGIARDGFAIEWRGQRFDFAPSLDDLGAAGIELSRREIETGGLTPQQMLRYVCEKLNHPFFLEAEELRDLLDKRAWSESDEPPDSNNQLELVLQTRDWIHPRSGGGDPDEDEWEISPHEAFEALSQVLATRDLAVWEAQDETKFNSHWSNWAEIEAETERDQLEQIAVSKTELRAYVERFPLETRLVLLEHFKEIFLPTSPSFVTSGISFFQLDGEETFVRLFPGLLPEIDAMLVEYRDTKNEGA